MEGIERMNLSKEQTLFLKKQKRTTYLTHAVRIGVLVLLLGIWEIAADLSWVNPFITSSPSRIFRCTCDLAKNGNLLYHVGTTLWETLTGFALAVLLGFILALLLWWSDFFRRIAEPYLIVLNALPKIALGPLIIIWCGTGSRAIVLMTVLVSLIVAVMNLANGFLATDAGKIKLLESMRATKAQILFKLVFPSSLPSVFSMLKLCVGMAWIGSVMGEYMVSKAGLGYLIVYGGQVFKLDLVMSATVLLCLLAGIMYALVALLEKILVKRY
ncbi:MAG: ABC transporter permease [Clostridia bacterium]|nr:ABC transporter permease [Clostridia bacterium]